MQKTNSFISAASLSFAGTTERGTQLRVQSNSSGGGAMRGQARHGCPRTGGPVRAMVGRRRAGPRVPGKESITEPCVPSELREEGGGALGAPPHYK